MIVRIGNAGRLAFDVHPVDPQSPSMRVIDIWLGHQLLTEHDNTAYVPQFRISMQRDVHALQMEGKFTPPFDLTIPLVDHFDALYKTDDGRREDHGFAQWGPTTDRFDALLFRVGEWAVVVARQRSEGEGFVHGEAIEVEMTQTELTTLLRTAIAALES